MKTLKFDTAEYQLTNESREILFQAKNVPVKISFFWNNDGRLIPFEGGPKQKKTYSKNSANVKITNHKYTQLKQNWENWEIEINNERITGSVIRYNWTGTNLNVKMIVGWG